MADLLPCPFCGGQGGVLFEARAMAWIIDCDSCWAEVGADTEADAVAAWNRRISPPVPARTRWRVSPWRDPVVVERRHVRRTARPS